MLRVSQNLIHINRIPFISAVVITKFRHISYIWVRFLLGIRNNGYFGGLKNIIFIEEEILWTNLCENYLICSGQR